MWTDGCTYDCECLDDMTGQYKCSERFVHSQTSVTQLIHVQYNAYVVTLINNVTIVCEMNLCVRKLFQKVFRKVRTFADISNSANSRPV